MRILQWKSKGRLPAGATKGYSTAVSLHSHTLHSRESLDFVPRALAKAAPANFLLKMAEARHQRKSGKRVEYERAFWRPPLNPRSAYDLECGQIREKLALEPLVSITDHDEMQACADLRTLGVNVPYSTEWTVPFGEAIFHIGIHNLPAEQASAFGQEMARYTANPTPALLRSILAEVHAIPSTLIVLNHPFVTELRLDRPEHTRYLQQILREYGEYFHALELNGLQSASDNCDVMRLSDAVGLPVISGGDRHCLEPNANLNLTRAATFDEFVSEVRYDHLSQVLFMPQYREPLASRYIEFIWHAVKDYREQLGRERWTDRTFYYKKEGGIATLSELWPNGGPGFIRWFIGAVGFLAAPPMKATLRRALGEEGEIA